MTLSSDQLSQVGNSFTAYTIEKSRNEQKGLVIQPFCYNSLVGKNATSNVDGYLLRER